MVASNVSPQFWSSPAAEPLGVIPEIAKSRADQAFVAKPRLGAKPLAGPFEDRRDVGFSERR
jgi:hypothetical protein